MRHRRGHQALRSQAPPINRRMRRKARQAKQQIRRAWFYGAFVGLIVSSVALAHATETTQAMMTDESTVTSNIYSTARDFPESDNVLATQSEMVAEEVRNAEDMASKALSKERRVKKSIDAEQQVGVINSALQAAKSSLLELNSLKGKMDQIAALDSCDLEGAQTKVSTAMDGLAGATVQSQGMQPSPSLQYLQYLVGTFQQVAEWSSAADVRATAAYESAVSTELSIQGDYKEANNILSNLKASENEKAQAKDSSDGQSKKKDTTQELGSPGTVGTNGSKSDGSETENANGNASDSASSNADTGSASDESESRNTDASGPSNEGGQSSDSESGQAN